MTSSIAIGKRVSKSIENIHGWKAVDTIPEGVCIVYIGGDGTETDKMANGYAKVLSEEIIKPLSQNIPVYSLKYNFSDGDKNISRRVLFNQHKMELYQCGAIKEQVAAKSEEINPQYVEVLYKKIIEPRISTLSGRKKREVIDACQQIRQLNIVAHCHGGYVALKLEELMQQKMQALGYTKLDAEAIQKQLLVVAHAPGCPLGVSKSTFISFISAADGEIPQANNNFAQYVNRKMQKERRQLFAQEKPDGGVITNNHLFDLKPSFFPDQQGNFFLIKNRYAYDSESDLCLIDYFEHNDISYSAKDQTDDGKLMANFSKNIITNALLNSLQQEQDFIPLPPLEDLICSSDKTSKEQELATFNVAVNNGRLIWDEIKKYSILNRKPIKSSRDL